MNPNTGRNPKEEREREDRRQRNIVIIRTEKVFLNTCLLGQDSCLLANWETLKSPSNWTICCQYFVSFYSLFFMTLSPLEACPNKASVTLWFPRSSNCQNYPTIAFPTVCPINCNVSARLCCWCSVSRFTGSCRVYGRCWWNRFLEGRWLECVCVCVEPNLVVRFLVCYYQGLI
jgi:hypothetical protein